MKKIVFLCSLSLILFSATFSQTTYQSAIGLRIGTGYADLFSASFKTFLAGTPGALELNFGVNPGNNHQVGCCVVGEGTGSTMISFSAAYEYHFPIVSVPGLQWFIGGGATLTNTFSDNNNYSGVGVGLFPTGGADYKFGKIPLDVSADIRPTFRIASPTYYTYDNFYFPDFGFSARYTFR